jgi:hypothetical protein
MYLLLTTNTLYTPQNGKNNAGINNFSRTERRKFERCPQDVKADTTPKLKRVLLDFLILSAMHPA